MLRTNNCIQESQNTPQKSINRRVWSHEQEEKTSGQCKNSFKVLDNIKKTGEMEIYKCCINECENKMLSSSLRCESSLDKLQDNETRVRHLSLLAGSHDLSSIALCANTSELIIVVTNNMLKPQCHNCLSHRTNNVKDFISVYWMFAFVISHGNINRLTSSIIVRKSPCGNMLNSQISFIVGAIICQTLLMLYYYCLHTEKSYFRFLVYQFMKCRKGRAELEDVYLMGRNLQLAQSSIKEKVENNLVLISHESINSTSISQVYILNMKNNIFHYIQILKTKGKQLCLSKNMFHHKNQRKIHYFSLSQLDSSFRLNPFLFYHNISIPGQNNSSFMPPTLTSFHAKATPTPTPTSTFTPTPTAASQSTTAATTTRTTTTGATTTTSPLVVVHPPVSSRSSPYTKLEGKVSYNIDGRQQNCDNNNSSTQTIPFAASTLRHLKAGTWKPLINTTTTTIITLSTKPPRRRRRQWRCCCCRFFQILFVMSLLLAKGISAEESSRSGGGGGEAAGTNGVKLEEGDEGELYTYIYRHRKK